MIQWLRAPASLQEDLGLIPSVNTATLDTGDPTHRYCICEVHRHICRENTRSILKFKDNIFKEFKNKLAIIKVVEHHPVP